MTDKRLLVHARRLRSEQTDAELRLWFHLRAGRFFGHKFKRQKPIGPFIVDFACMESALIVELDGGHHHERAAYDAARTAFLEGEGFKVLRFWNDDVLIRTDDVLEQIRLAVEARSAWTLPLGPYSASGRGETVNDEQEKSITDLSPLPLAGEGGPKGRERARRRRVPPA